jgi:murein DD-endopeptidase MepM/ murein hydrolase activator NlpD
LFGLIGLAALQGHAAGSATPDSLLYTLLADEEVIEGPLDPATYGQADSPNARLAAIGGDSIDYITYTDVEVFSSALGGTAVVAPQDPLGGELTEPGAEALSDSTSPTQTAEIYTVRSGDTLASIASQFNINIETIRWANGLSTAEALQIGDDLTILPVNGVLHTVRSGDTVSEIARKYEVSASEILAFNGIESADKLGIGRKIIVPGGTQLDAAPASRTRLASHQDTAEATTAQPPSQKPESPLKAIGKGLVWPTTTNHISQYFRWGHTGIDIDNRSRPAVFAAEGGVVQVAKRLGGYGNLLVVKSGNYEFYYAHLDKFYVSVGDKVAKGEAIGKMGSTGRSTGPHLHFEVRVNGRPTNPLGYF